MQANVPHTEYHKYQPSLIQSTKKERKNNLAKEGGVEELWASGVVIYIMIRRAEF